MTLDELIEKIKSADAKTELHFIGDQFLGLTFTDLANALKEHTPKTVTYISFTCEALEDITSKELSDILEALPNIEYLDLSANGIFLIDGIEDSLENLKPSIKYLFLSESDLGKKLNQIEDEDKLAWLEKIFKNFKNLEHLNLSSNNLEITESSAISKGFKYLSQNLKTLDLSLNKITGNVFNELPKTLNSINLSNNYLFVEEQPGTLLPDDTKYLPENIKKLTFEGNFSHDKQDQLLTLFKELPSTLNEIDMGKEHPSCFLGSKLSKDISSRYIQELQKDEIEAMEQNLKASAALIPGLFYNFSKYKLARFDGFDKKRIQHSAKHFEAVIPSNMKFNSELAIKDIFEYNVAKFLTPKDASNLAIARGKPRSILT